ncbi:VCBS domain-containing protein [Vibrio breoganii]
MANEDKNKQATEVSKKKSDVKKVRKARRFVIPRVYVPRPSTVAFVLPSYHVGSSSAEEGLESEISHTEYAGNPQHEAYTPIETGGTHTVHPEPTPYVAGGEYEPPHHIENKGNHHFTHENHYGKPVTPLTGTPTNNFGQTGATPVPVIASHSGGHKDYSYLTPPVVGAPESGTVVEDTTLAVSGTVDIHSAQKGAPLTFTPDNVHGQYGEFTLNKDTGEWSYALDNSHHQNLAQGETHTEILHVTATSAAGVSVHQDITVTVQGTNDIPVITSHAQHESTKEDDVLFVNGQVTASDVDHEAVLTYTPDDLQGQYGLFSLNSSSGKWTYTLDNKGVQALAEGEHHTETMLVTVTDEHGATTTQQVSIEVTGTNDRPVISSQPQVDTVKEDGTLFVKGQVIASDVDHGAVLTYTPDNLQGQYGAFTLNASTGKWHYTLDNSAHQALAQGEMHAETMLVTVTDEHGSSTTQQVVITVEGTNDNPIITHITSRTANEGDKVISGTITSTDVDHGDTATYSTTFTHPGFTLGTDGAYTLDPTDASFDHLAVGEHETLIIPVIATDKSKGTSQPQNLVIRIDGTNDAPVVTFTDNGGDHTHGSLSNTDVDTTDTHTYAVTGSTVSGTTQTFTGQFGDLVLDTATGKYTYIQHQSVAGMSIDNQGVYHGKEFFEVSTSDNHGGTSTKYLTFEPSMLVSAPAKDGDPAVLTPKLNQVPQLLDNQPNIPKITPPNNKLDELHIDPTTDTGSSHTDGITNIDTPTITGHSGVPFSVISLVDNNGNEVAKTTSNKDGDFSVTLSQLSGSVSGELHSITGHAMAPSSTPAVDTPTPLQLTIDTDIDTPIVSLTDGSKGTTTNPNTVISATELTHVDISGEIDHSGVTTELTGLTVTDTNGNIATLDPTLVTLDPTTGKFTLTGVDLSSYGFVDGQLTVHATATDLAGNSKTGTSIAQLDTHPGTISIDTTLGGDNVINAKETQSPLTISGTTTEIEAGQQVTIEFNGQQYHAIVQPDHTWTTDVPVVDLAKLPDGTTPIITATVTDLAGNEAKPATHDLTIDTSIDKTTVKLVDGGAGANFDGVINLSEQTHAVITGTIDPTATLTVLTVTDGTHTIDVPLNSVMVGANGDFTANGVDLSSLTDGQLTVTATAVDPAGNESTNTGNTLMDTAPPKAPKLTDVPIDNDKTPTFTGTSEPGSTISFTDENGHLLGSTITGQGGSFSFTPTQDLPDGGKISATSTDTHGNTSAPTSIDTNIDTSITPTTVDMTDGTIGSTEHPNHLIDKDESQHVSITGTIDHSDGTETLTGLTVTDSQGHTAPLDPTTATLDSTGKFSLSKVDISKAGLVDGELTVHATAIDKAGNTSTGTGTATLDTQIDQTQIALTDSGSNTDGVINASEKGNAEITGSIDPTAVLTSVVITDTQNHQLIVPVASIAVDQTGHFTANGIDLTSLTDGQLTITATAVDPAGNESTNTGNTLMDTAPPKAPQLTPVPIDNDKTPTFTGTSEPGSTISFTDENGHLLGTTITGQGGSFSFTPTQDLPDGGKVSATSTDTHGNTSAPTSIDTNIDTSIAPTTVDMTDGTTGSIAHPNHLIDEEESHHVSITGTIDHVDGTEKLTEVTVTDGHNHTVKVDLSHVTLDKKTGVFSLSKVDISKAGLVDGELTVHATAIDKAGNTSTGKGTATLDTHPGTIAIDPTLSVDNVVNAQETQSPLVISGTVTGIEAGQIVDVELNGNTYHATVDGKGGWSTIVPQPDVAKLPDGSLDIQANVQDKAGNQSSTISHQLSVDTHVGAPTSITFEGTGIDSIYNINEVGTDGTITASIGLPTDAQIGDVLTINGVQHTLTGQNIKDQHVETEVLPDEKITASLTDKAGNSSTDLSNTAPNADLTPPLQPTLTPIPNADHNKDNTPPIIGTTEPGALVEISIDGKHVGQVKADKSGSFSYTPPQQTDGPHSITAIATDVAGNQSPPSTPITTTIDTTPPAQLGLQLTTDTGSSSSDLITSNGQLTITGQETGAHTLYSVDGGHTWTNSFTPIEGSNSVSVKQVDPAGNESKPTGLTFTLDTKVAAPQVALKTDTGSSNTDHITQHGELEVTGTESGAHIEYSIDGGKTWVDNLGQQVDGQYTALVRQTDVAGNVSGSTTINYTIDTDTQIDVDIKDTSPTAAASFNQDNFLNKVEIDTNLNQISGHLDSDGELTALVISDTHGGKVTLDLTHVNLHSDGSFDISGIDLSSLAEGELTVTATSVDTAGNHATETATIYKDTQNTATDVTNAVKEETKTTVSGHVNLEADAHGVQSTIVTGSLSGDISGTYGTMHLNRDGSYTYDLDNTNSKVQALGEGVQITDTLTYTTIDPAGNSKESHLVVTITGTNDAAVIGGVTTGAVIEDKTPDAHHQLAVSGTLTISDIDTNTNISGGEEQFKVDPSSITHGKNTWGHLTIYKDGNWDYRVDNQGKVQHLQEGKTHTDTFTVHSVDGAAQDITVVITGTKDAPVITGGAQSGSVIEAGSTAAGSTIHGHATAQGSFSSTDLDHLPTSDSATWSIVASATGNQQQTDDTHVQGIYGHLEIYQNGDWKYVLDNTDPDTQALTAGQKVSESFNVRVTDSTSLTDEQTVTVNITGSNDQAKITGTDIGTVTEDKDLQGGNLHTTGTLSVTDVDSGEAHFTAETLPGTYGNLVMQENGTWTYTADNSQHVIQELKATDSLPDTFTITSADGTKHKVAVTINGTNDLPTIDHVHDTGAVTEDGSHADKNHKASQVIGTPTASGTLVANEVDKGDPAHWAVAHGQGTYGSLSIDSKTGHWTYTLDNSLNSAADKLAAGDHKTETFTVTDTDSSGQAVTHEIKINVTGSNDVPVITGDSTGSVTEAGGTANAQVGVASIDGDLTAADPDNNDGTLVWSVQGATSGSTTKEGTYGSITIDQNGQNGHWTYQLDDSKDATQKLTGIESPEDHFIMLVKDSSGGLIKHEVVVTVHGSNDNPVLAAYKPSSFAEDSHIQKVKLPTVSDVDDTHLTYSIDSHPGLKNNNVGQWITIDKDTGVISVHTNAKILQHLSQGASHLEHVVVTVTDAQRGTTQQTLDLTITGTNDQPKITRAKISSDLDENGSKVTNQYSVTHNALSRVDVIEDHIVSGKIQYSDIDDKISPIHPTGDVHRFYIVDDHGNRINRPDLLLDPKTGSFQFNAGVSTYQHLQEGQTEPVTIKVQVVDQYGGENTKELHFVVHGRNDLPEVIQQHPLQVLEDGVLKFSAADLAGNNHQFIVDPDGDTIAISGVKIVAGADGKTHGSIVDLGMGNYQYTPDKDFNGNVKLQYMIEDGRGHTIVTNGEIVVTPQNDRPTQGPTELSHVHEDSGSVTFTVQDLLKNTHDIDNPGSSNHDIELVPGTVKLPHSQGTLVENAGGSWTFTPDPDWNSNKGGGDVQISFEYIDEGTAFGQASGRAQAVPGSATIKIDPIQDPAVIHVPHSPHLPEVTDRTHSDVSGTLTVTDPDLNEDHFKAASSIQGTHGFANINTKGEWEYHLNPTSPVVQALGEGEEITDSIKVHSVDGTEATLTIRIHGTNDQPIITVADQITATEANANDKSAQGHHKFVEGQFIATDPDVRDHQTFSLVGFHDEKHLPASFLQHVSSHHVPGLTLETSGKYQFDRTNPAYNYLKEGETLTFDIEIQVTDGHGGKDTRVVSVVVTGTNDAPVIDHPIPSLGTVGQGQNSLTFKEGVLVASATDPDGDALSIFKVGTQHQHTDVQVLDPALGHVDEDGNGGYIFHPSTAASGKDVTIAYKVTDGHAQTVATSTIHVDPDPHNNGNKQAPTSSHTSTTKPPVSDIDKITGDLTGGVNEDGGSSYTDAHNHQHQLKATGHVQAKSPSDAHAHGVQGANHSPGTYGYLTVKPGGDWEYHLYPHTGLTDPVNQLSEGDALTDHIAIESAHSGHQDITITIHGSNDKPVVTGQENIKVFEQGTSHVLAQNKAIVEVDKMHLEGDLKATDVDHNDHVIYTVDPSNALQGFTIDNKGHYTYQPTHSDPILNGLKPSETRDVTAKVLVSDGHGGNVIVPIHMTVHGRNTAPTADSHVNLGHSDEDLTVQIDGTSIGQGHVATQAGSVDLIALAHAKDAEKDPLHVVNIKVVGGHGTFTDQGNGVYKFVPEGYYHGPVEFTYGISDGLETKLVKATLTIDSFNDKPVAGDFALNPTEEDHPVHFTAHDIIGSGTAADHGHETDPDFATDGAHELIVLTDVELVDKSQGTLTSDGLGGYTFTPAKDINGQVQVRYTVHDSLAGQHGVSGGQQVDSGIATIKVTSVNDKPVIVDTKHESATEDDKSTFVAEGKLDITDGDSGEGHFVPSSHMRPNSGGDYGYLEIDKQGNWKYHLMKNHDSHIQSLAAGEKLQEHFILKTDDGGPDHTTHELVVDIVGTNDGATISGSATGTVNSDVTAAVTEQLASSTSTVAPQHEMTASGKLTVADVDHGEDGFKVQTLTSTGHNHHYGTLTIQQNGSWAYIIDNNRRDVQQLHEGEKVVEHFTVTSIDGTATHTITVTLVGKNNAPVVAHVASQAATESGTKLTGQLHATDIDNDSSSMTYSLQSGTHAPAGFVLHSDGSYSFDPKNGAYNALAKGEHQTITAHVVATDNHHGTSEPKDIEIVIAGTNDAATISGPSTINVTDNSSVNSHTVSSTQQLHISDVDHNENHFRAQSSIAPDSSNPSQSGLSTSAYGHLSITDDGHWKYHVDHADRVKAIPNRQHVTETFTVHAIDGTAHTITVTLDGKNEAATFSGTLVGEVVDGTSTSVSGTLKVTDIDHGESGFTVENSNIQPSHTDTHGHSGLSSSSYGHLRVDTQGHWAYNVDDGHAFQQIPAGQAVTETFSVHAKDGTSHNVVITLTGSNDAPTVSGDVTRHQHGLEDRVITLDTTQLLAHATDIDSGDTLTVANVHAAHGHVTVDKNGHFKYQPDHDYHGRETFTYDVTDSSGAKVQTHATMTVNSVNDAPVAHAAPALAGIDEDVHKMFTSSDLLKGATDVDHDSLVVLNNSVTAEHGKVTYDANTHKFNYQPNSNYHGKETLHYKISDGHGGTADQTATFDITSVNDAPSVSKPVSLIAHQEDYSVTLTEQQLLANAHDNDHDTLHVKGLTVDYGSITHNHDGTWSFKPQANYNGPVVFSYQVADGHGGTTDTTASMTVTADNDAAVIKLESGVMLPTTGQHPTTAGRLLITDVDGHAQEQFKAATGLPGTYGNFDMLTDGQFKYTLTNQHNPTIHNLVAGQSVTDSVTVRSADGTPFTVDVTIYGHDNHAPTVSQGAPIVMLATEQHQFSLSDFSFQDADMDTLDHITITDLPSQGELTFDGKPVTANQEIDAADIDKLVFTSHQGDHDNVIFHVAASDGHVDSAVTNVTMHVNPTPALVNAIPTPIGQTPQVIGSSDEPDTAIVDQAPIITLQDIAAATPASSGAQAYLAHLGIVQHNHDGPQSLDTPADLDLIFASSEVILDEHGAGVGSSTIMGDDTHDLEHQTHDDFNHHHDLLVEHHY